MRQRRETLLAACHNNGRVDNSAFRIDFLFYICTRDGTLKAALFSFFVLSDSIFAKQFIISPQQFL